MLSLQSVKFNGVTSIGANSFQNCIQLESVQFTSCLTIGNYAFSVCLVLTNVDFPKLTTIGAYGFEKAGLTEIELNSVFILNTKLDILRGLECCQFSGCSKLTRITMKNLPLIQSCMFENCNSLIYVDIPNCLQIGLRAFIGCNSIGEYAFSSIVGLTEVNLPSVNSIGNFASIKCKSLRSASFSFCSTVGKESFSDCSVLESIKFPKLTKIGTSAFANTGLTEVKMNSFIEIETEFELWIGDVGRQFSGCSKLTKVTMNNLRTLKSHAFEDCGLLNEINIPSCTTVETNSLIGCKNIKKLPLGYLSVNFVSIPNPTILTHIYFPFALSVLDGTFSKMKELVSIKLPLITKVGSGLFRDHSKLTEVLLPRVNEITGDFTFNNCENLELISLQSLEKVDPSFSNLFQGCKSLKFIYLPDKPPKVFNPSSFQGLSCSVVVPNDSIKIYDNDLSIEDDVENDHKWCGIELKDNNFVNCSVNLLWSGIGFNIKDSIIVSGMDDSDGVVTSQSEKINITINNHKRRIKFD